MRMKVVWTIALFLLGAATAVGELPQAVLEAMGTVSPAGGWAVHVGARDGKTEIELAKGERWVVTGLAYDAASATRARQAAAEAGMSGRAAIHRVIDTTRLPMADRSVGLLIVDRDALGDVVVAQSETRRVLRPGGVAVILEDQAVTSTHTAPWPQTIDNWTHYDYDATAANASADQQVGPMKSTQWLGGESLQDDIVGMRSASGVQVTIENNRPGGPTAPPNGVIIARDAFSGVVLWRREGFYAQSRYSFVLDDQRVYLHAMDRRTFKPAPSFRDPYNPNDMPMIALDLKTGEDRVTYDQGIVSRTVTPDPRAMTIDEQADLMTALVSDGKLIQKRGGQLVVLDPATVNKLWSYTSADGEKLGFIAVSEGKLVATQGPSYDRMKMGYLDNTPIFTATAVLAFDLRTGKQLWSSRPAGLADWPHTIGISAKSGAIAMIGYLKYHNTQLKSGMTVLDLDTGKQRWAKDITKPKATSGGHFPRPQIHHGLVWSSGAGGAVGFDPRTGEIKSDLSGNNFRCSVNRATPHWLIASQKFTQIDSGNTFFTEATRGRCDFGLFPANGLVYGSNLEQCKCAAFIRAAAAFGTDRLPPEPWQGERLIPGPAGPGQAKAYTLEPADWPMFLHDARHSSWSDTPIAQSPAKAWESRLAQPPAHDNAITREWAVHEQVPGPVTAPTCLDGLVSVGLSHAHAVVALDAATGKERWRALLDGRIDSPPTQAGDSVFVGTRTGWVYALDRATGVERWRFLAAPHQRLIVAHGQAESAWPVFGSLLLKDGLIYAAAGRQAELDHGIYWYGLDPATGAVRQRGRLSEDEDWHASFGAPRTRATNQPLATDGQHLVLWRSGIDPATGKQVRFGSTVKQLGGPEKPADVLLGSALWGKMRIDGGAAYRRYPGDLFAFYGLLKQGAAGMPAHIDLEAAGRFEGACAIAGELYDLGDYPGLVEGDGVCQAVRYRIADTTIVAALDAFEDHVPGDPAASLYLRKRISLLDAAGAKTGEMAWAYIYHRPVTEAARIPSGDWPIDKGRTQA